MRKLRKNIILLFASVSLLITSCQPEDFEPVLDRPGNELEDYLNTTVNLMQIHSINRLKIDWNSFRNTVLDVMGNDSSLSEVNAPLRTALRLLDDNHSFIRRPDGTFLSAGPIGCPSTNPSSLSLPDNIGYVRVRTFSGSAVDQDGQNYIQDIRNQIRAQDKENLKGWVVDLRDNLGGNMYPMIAGIGPILGEGTAGHFIDPSGSTNAWSYADHWSIVGGDRVSQANDKYELINPNPRVAVLIDGAVASSGEAVTISFIGRENTRLFGSPSCGLSTGNRGLRLKDDSMLSLTSVYMADRNKNKFGGRIVPDQLSSTDELVEDVVAWMNQ